MLAKVEIDEQGSIVDKESFKPTPKKTGKYEKEFKCFPLIFLYLKPKIIFLKI